MKLKAIFSLFIPVLIFVTACSGGGGNSESHVYVAEETGYYKDDVFTSLSEGDYTAWCSGDITVNKNGVLVAGKRHKSTLDSNPGYWLNGTWYKMPGHDSSNHNYAVNCHFWGTTILLGGSLEMTQAVYWDGSDEQTLDVAGSVSSSVLAISEYNGSIYAAGGYKDSGNTYHDGYWVDGVWNEVADNTSFTTAYMMRVYQDNVYILGTYDNAATGNKEFGYWHGTTWNSLRVLLDDSSGISEEMDNLPQLVVNNGKVYAAAGFKKTDNSAGTSTWSLEYFIDGAVTVVESALTSSTGVRGLAVYDGDVYILKDGDSTTSGYWLNETWNGMSYTGGWDITVY